MPRRMTISRVERDALQTRIGLLGAIAVATGVNAIFAGPKGEPGGERINASLDSEFRFAHVFWVAAGAGLWWTIPAPERRASVAQGVLALAATGGLARLISIRREGLPHPVFRGALILELAVLPPVIAWHRRVFGG